MDWMSVLAGGIAITIAAFLSILLLFVMYRIDSCIVRLTYGIDEVANLKGGNMALGIVLGSVILSQALLFRHALVPVMTVIRMAFINPHGQMQIAWVAAYALLIIAIMGILSIVVVGMILWLFAHINTAIREQDEVLAGNTAVAVFLALVIIGATIIIDQGMEDLAMSLVPRAERGIIPIR
ncbi:MAG: hypothetical protein JW832_16125 [Deltaproteobacteria bacterium]|nr:hypothetical protein [Deltaproteobacteria bacterium]